MKKIINNLRKRKDDITDFISIMFILIFGTALYVIAKDPLGISDFGKLLKPISSMLLKIGNVFNFLIATVSCSAC